jgi:hypothetical protein
MAITEAQTKTSIQDTVKFYDQLRILAGTSTFAVGTAEVTPVAAITQQLTCVADYRYSDWSDKEAASLQTSRDALASVIESASQVYGWLIRDYGQALGVAEKDTASVFQRIYDDYVTNSKSIESRGLTFGSSSAGASNVGNGVIVRCNFDENGFVLENQTADAKNTKCLFDANNGASKWEEVFEIRGATAARDKLAITGSGKIGSITAISARTSANIVKNPSFSNTTGTSSPPTSLTAIASWSVTTFTNGFDSLGSTGVNGYYRDFPGDTTPLALRIKVAGGDQTISQNLETNRSKFDEKKPYLIQVAWRRKGSATGTLTLRLGNSSTSVAISTGTNDVWNILRMPVTSSWFKSFDKAGLTLSVETSSLATSNVDIDDVIVAPMTLFDGSWYAYVGTPATGDPLQWLRNDTFSWTDTELGEGYGVIQKMFCWRGLGSRYLPAIPQTPAEALAAALAGAGAGNVENGIHYYRFTYVDGNGIESGLSASANATVADKTTNGKVSVSSVAVGPAGTASRKVYRTVAAAADSVGNYKLLTTISDNSTTVFTDNVADASLGATASARVQAGITMADPT